MTTHTKLSDIHYNQAPPHFREITEHEFGHGFFMYILKPHEHRQLYDDNKVHTGSIKLWEVSYPGWEGMGYGMAHDYWGKKMKYFKFGSEERWSKNESAFAAQFAGDNS